MNSLLDARSSTKLGPFHRDARAHVRVGGAKERGPGALDEVVDFFVGCRLLLLQIDVHITRRVSDLLAIYSEIPAQNGLSARTLEHLPGEQGGLVHPVAHVIIL